MSTDKEGQVPASNKAKGDRWWRALPATLTRFRAGDIVQANALEALPLLRDEIADIVFLDPPFNLGKRYGAASPSEDRKPDPEYAQFLRQVLEESARILRPGGALYLYHIPKWAIRLVSVLNDLLTFRHWIAIGMKNGFVRGRGLYPAHYVLLHYTKGSPAVLNRPKIAPPTCPHCGEYVRDYGGYIAHVANGINLSDFWDDVSPVRHKKYKLRIENELPIIIPKRVVAISGRRGGLLVDPFAGTGGALIAARSAGMRFVAIDKEPSSVDLIRSRLEAISGARVKSMSDGVA